MNDVRRTYKYVENDPCPCCTSTIGKDHYCRDCGCGYDDSVVGGDGEKIAVFGQSPSPTNRVAESLKDRLTKTPEDRRLYEQERAVTELTELICKTLERRGESVEQLAARMEWVESYLPAVLDGCPVTVRDCANILYALGHRLHFSAEPLED